MNKQDLTIAINSFKRVIYNKAFSDKVLSSYDGNIESVNFIKYTLFGTLRDYYFIEDYLVPQFIEKRKLKKFDNFLISSIFIALFLVQNSRKKDYTIVNMIVDIVKKEVNIGASKVFNGVLRNAIRKGIYDENIKILIKNSDFYKKIARDYPKTYNSIIEKMINNKIAIGGFFSNNSNSDKYDKSDFSDEYFYVKPKDIATIEKTFVFQDLANHLLMKSFSPFIEDKKINLEVSAYPGGKSFYINKGKSIHCDILPWKVKALKERLEKTENRNMSFVVADGSNLPFKDNSIDNIFLDVPCSGSGIIKKKPEIVINFTELNMKNTINLQKEILNEAARVTKIGGRIFYSTCTIFKGENESQIKKFLTSHKNFILDDKYTPPINIENYYSSVNELDNMDGIFGTILLKKD